MGVIRAGRRVLTGLLMVCLAAGPGRLCFAEDVPGIEKKTSIESVKSDFEDGLGLTPQQREKIGAIRRDFKTRQAAIRDELGLRQEALRQELDGDAPVRAKVDPILAQIKELQGQLMENRVDVVFKLRDVYTSRQIKLIRKRAQQQNKTITSQKQKKNGKKGKKLLIRRK